MNKYVSIHYADAILRAPYFLKKLWPYHLPLDNFPSFCGAGNGWGDWLIPDSIKRTTVSDACFIHDIDWAISDNTWRYFQAANNRFLRNLISRLISKLNGIMLIRGLVWAVLYWAAVSTVGWQCYGSSGIDWQNNEVVKEKLNRLAMAEINCSRKN